LRSGAQTSGRGWIARVAAAGSIAPHGRPRRRRPRGRAHGRSRKPPAAAILEEEDRFKRANCLRPLPAVCPARLQPAALSGTTEEPCPTHPRAPKERRKLAPGGSRTRCRSAGRRGSRSRRTNTDHSPASRQFFWVAARDAPTCPPGKRALSTARALAAGPARERSHQR
jgi:hypothetical protein